MKPIPTKGQTEVWVTSKNKLYITQLQNGERVIHDFCLSSQNGQHSGVSPPGLTHAKLLRKDT